MSVEKSRSDRFVWVIVVLGLAAGLVGLFDRLTVGHEAAGYGSYIPWGLWVAGYIYLTSLSAGAFVMASLVLLFRVKVLERVGVLALLTALTTLIGALLLIWMDLGHMGRAWRMVVHTNFRSVMGWMAWLYGAYFVLLLVSLWHAMRVRLVLRAGHPGLRGAVSRLLALGSKDVSEKSRRRDAKRLQVLAAIGLPLAIGFDGSVGAIFGVVGARPYWNSGLTPVLFLVGALLSGAALFTMTIGIWGPRGQNGSKEDALRLMGRIVGGLLALDILMEWADISVGLWSSLPSEGASLRLVMFGPYAWVFWFVHVFLGILVPSILLILGQKRTHLVTWAGGLIALTFLSVRLNIVLPGLAVPELEGLRNAFTGPGLSFEYFPSTSEWLLFVFAVSVAAMVFMAGKSLLPVFDQDQSHDARS